VTVPPGLVGRHRSDPRLRGVGHDAAGPARRVDRRRGVRRAQGRSPRGVRPIIRLDDVALDGSLHKAPYGGEGTGPNATDRGKSGWKWSVASERRGIPIGWATDGATRNDVRMLEPTLDAIERSACSSTSARCISTVATTRRPCAHDSDRRASTSTRSSSGVPRSLASRSSRCDSGCAGSSKQPTPGRRTTGSSAATPTEKHAALPVITGPPLIPEGTGASQSKYGHHAEAGCERLHDIVLAATPMCTGSGR
jgi:hypothetical protein